MRLSRLKAIIEEYRFAIGVTLILAVLSGWVALRAVSWQQEEGVRQVRQEIETRLNVYATALSTSITKRMGLVSTLRAIAETAGDTEDAFRQFTLTADKMWKSEHGIRILGLAPGAVTTAVYPREGNEAVIGVSILANPQGEAGPKAGQAIATGEIVASDPYVLRQGGLGFFQRAAAYRDGGSWGLVFVGSDIQVVLREAGITENDPSLVIGVRDSRDQVFFGSQAAFAGGDPVIAVVSAPGIRWEIAALPREGWQAANDFPLMAALIWLLGNSLAALLLFQRQTLIRMVRQRTEELEIRATELAKSEQKYKALLHQGTDPIILCEYETGRIVEVNPAFLHYFGYDESEAIKLSLGDLYWQAQVAPVGEVIPSGFAAFRGKDGKAAIAEMVETAIESGDRKYRRIVFRQPSRERIRESIIRAEVDNAGQIQKAMLPTDYSGADITVKTVFAPASIVSGDFFDYRWTPAEQILRGYLLDVSGHGIGTAVLTATIGTLLTEEIENGREWTTDYLEELNLRLVKLAPANYFSAVLLFTLDLSAKQMTCISGGINHYLTAAQDDQGWKTIPGSFLGISPNAVFQQMNIPVQPGDTFYFLTDGLTELIGVGDDATAAGARNFEGTIDQIKSLVSAVQLDDQSAVCIRINALPSP